MLSSGSPKTSIALCQTAANNAHERALTFLTAMPRIWLDYTQFLSDQRFVTRTRETFDRALRALPVPQHERIWQAYLGFVNSVGEAELALRVQVSIASKSQ